MVYHRVERNFVGLDTLIKAHLLFQKNWLRNVDIINLRESHYYYSKINLKIGSIFFRHTTPSENSSHSIQFYFYKYCEHKQILGCKFLVRFIVLQYTISLIFHLTKIPDAFRLKSILLIHKINLDHYPKLQLSGFELHV